MTKKYFLSKLCHNRFVVDFSCEFMGITLQCLAKIDTGAEVSLLPLRTVNFDMLAGVEDQSKDNFYTLLESRLDSGDNKIQVKTISNAAGRVAPHFVYLQDVVHFKLCNLKYFDRVSMGISCVSEGNILIGMDILQHFDFHCGVSLVNDMDNDIVKGDYLFVGCLKDDITDEYLNTLKRYFTHGDNRV
ncbi:MAG: hypothetical protein K2H91_11785 [Lachnospiraceae bacterium]|nr:hypothetical protein [Lachnospiraceae bacterium]